MNSSVTTCYHDLPGNQNAMIALYYCYPPNGIHDVSSHATFQNDLCTTLQLGGRIRVSNEGINGVLSGPHHLLREYELKLRNELSMSLMSAVGSNISTFKDHQENATHDWLDIKYCHLRKDISFEQQLFTTLSVKITKEVVSLIDFQTLSADGFGKTNTKNYKLRRQQKRMNKKELRLKLNHDSLKVIELANDNADTNGDYQHKSSTDIQGRIEELGLEENSDGHDSNRNCTNSNETKSIGSEHCFNVKNWKNYAPAKHLSPEEWNELLLSHSARHQLLRAEEIHTDQISCPDSGEAILLDARNVYETRVGHFGVPNLSTFFPNTRKFSHLPLALNTEEAANALAGKQVFMYCTGGVRCERAGSYLRALSESNSGAWKNKDPPKVIYQLRGGIQKYLETFGCVIQEDLRDTNESGIFQSESREKTNAAHVLSSIAQPICFYRGKNFVFDPRRTDPIIGNGIAKSQLSEKKHGIALTQQVYNTTIDENRVSHVGQCIKCHSAHDDYDNGNAPSEGKEARCCRCRVLILVCNNCRKLVQCWGESIDEKSEKEKLFCGESGMTCIDEGNYAENVETVTF